MIHFLTIAQPFRVLITWKLYMYIPVLDLISRFMRSASFATLCSSLTFPRVLRVIPCHAKSCDICHVSQTYRKIHSIGKCAAGIIWHMSDHKSWRNLMQSRGTSHRIASCQVVMARYGLHSTSSVQSCSYTSPISDVPTVLSYNHGNVSEDVVRAGTHNVT